MLYRRICVLNARGCPDEADALESGSFAAALETLRQSEEGRLLGEERLQHWLGTERNRVADAQVTAELLAPLLSNLLAQSPLSVSAETSSNPSRSAASQTAHGSQSSPAAPARATPPPAVAPSITDLLDGMLAQDRADSQSRAQRRAS